MLEKYCEFSSSICPNNIELREENQIFFAYSSHIDKVIHEINTAIINLKKETDINWISWENDLQIENDIIFCQICKKILNSKSIVTELSDLNFNVLFEYGYSIGLNKKIFPTVNNDFPFENIEKYIKPLMGIGFSRYENNNLHKKILKKKFWDKPKDNTIFSFSKKNILGSDTKLEFNNLFYIKNNDNQEVAEKIENEIEKFSIDTITDDSTEDYYNLSWYSKQIKKSYAVIIDIGESSPNVNFKHYSKCALIAGISVSSGRRVLLICSNKTDKPSDIISIIKTYEKGKEAAKQVYNFLINHSNEFSIISSYIQSLNHNKNSIFDKIDLGEHVAENDISYINDCFVKSPEYNKMLNSGYKLILGRKGTGKSASFLHLRNEKFSKDTIKISQYFDKYNLNDLYDLVSEYDNENDRNKIAQSYWHFILFSIIARNINDYIDNCTDFEIGNKDISDFKNYIKENPLVLEKNIITDSLVEIINDIRLHGIRDIKTIKTKFYTEQIIELKKKVISYLNNSGKKLIFNIDGLDSNISISIDNNLTSLILFNLHKACSDIFSRKIDNFSINLFIRKDLYDTFNYKITEKDKISKIYLIWNTEQLLQMINLRLQKNKINHIADILSEELKIHNLTKKIEKYLYIRPRDYIVFFNSLIYSAQSLKRNDIGSKSLNDSINTYAIHVNESLEAEFHSYNDKISISDLLSKIKETNNEKDRIPLNYFTGILTKIGIDKTKHDDFLEFLLRIEFLYLIENNEKINWRNLLKPQVKLASFLKRRNERKTLEFHPIINHLVANHY